MTEIEQKLVQLIWDLSNLEKKFQKSPYTLTSLELNLLKEREIFWTRLRGK